MRAGIIRNMRIRRRNPCFIEIGDELIPDLSALLTGTVSLQEHTRINLLCPISGQRIPLSPEELALVASLTAQAWHAAQALMESTGIDARAMDALVQRGVLVSDGPGAMETSVREGEVRLDALGWHPLAAIYHGMTRWQGVLGDEGSREHNDQAEQARLQIHAREYGPPPSHFVQHAEATIRIPLCAEAFDDDFARLLRSRCTTRHFDRAHALALSDLGRVLHGTFGAIGVQELAPGMVAVKRTSASGGALHPIEAYPLVLNVEGLAPGVYHYESGHHALALLKAMTETEARTLAAEFTIGQDYFADAGVLVIHVARLDRHHWKYRRHPKAYKAVLLDSGHLSQTFYLLAADRGLGAFYTAAINDADIGNVLSLDPQSRIALGVNGLGVIDASLHALHLQPEPWPPLR